jgi:hypothetical protein
MMAEPTMLASLRKMIDDESETMFSDNELQAVMDRYRTHVLYEYMDYDINYKRFWTKYRFLASATLWDSYDEDDQTELSPDTSNNAEGWFEFTLKQTLPIYLKAISYNLHGAAAECWMIIASSKAKLVQYSAGATQEQMNQAYQQAVNQSKEYAKKAFPPGAITLKREY